MFYIGIDTGTHTGVAVWDGERITSLQTLPIHKAMEFVLGMYLQTDGDICVIFEDARLRKWYGEKSNAKQQGAGSIKRDCSIWEDFLTDKGIPFKPIHPIKGGTKRSEESFKAITGWHGRTSEHSRDAAFLVLGR